MTLTKLSLRGKNCDREIDTTGRKHIFCVQNEKYQALRRRNRGNNSNNNNNSCQNCNQSDEYLEVLEKQIEQIEQISNKVNQLANATSKNQSSRFTINDPDFSQIDTDALINIAIYLNSDKAQPYTRTVSILGLA